MTIRQKFKDIGKVIHLPDLYVWITDAGDWGVGEMLIVDATDWTDEKFIELANTPPHDRWEKASNWASATNNQEGDKP